MHVATQVLAAAAPAADGAPSLFKLDSFSALGATIFGLLLILTAVVMAAKSKKAKIKENGVIVGNIGLAALVFVIGAGAVAFPLVKNVITYFTNIQL